MSNPETGILQAIRLAIGSLPAVRIFRNSVGTVRHVDGYWMPYGLCPGSPDLVGWKSVVVTPAMVGRRLAVFIGIEVKTKEGRPTAGQQAFLDRLKADGGIAGIARSGKEARDLIGASR